MGWTSLGRTSLYLVPSMPSQPCPDLGEPHSQRNPGQAILIFLIFLNILKYSEGFLRLCQLGDAKSKENLRKPRLQPPPGRPWSSLQPRQIDLGAAQGCPGLSAGLQTTWKQPQPHTRSIWDPGQTIEKQRLGAWKA